MHTSKFALGIGIIILKFNEIDFYTLVMKRHTTGKPVSKSWEKKELKDRLEKISAELTEKGGRYLAIAKSFELALHLVDVRNTVAHGSFIVLPSINLESESELGIYGIRSKTPPLSLNQIQGYAKCLSELSEKLNFQISTTIAKEAARPNNQS